MNKRFYLLTQSLTVAMKGNRILGRNSIPARVEKIGSAVTGKGCGFAIVVYDSPQRAVKILEENNIKVLSVKQR